MKRLALATICSLGVCASAQAFNPDDMVDYPNEFSQFWSDFAVQGYSCSNEIEATLKIVQFDGALSYFPRVARGIMAGGPSAVLADSSGGGSMDALIVSEGLATEISSVAGRSLIGVSEDTETHFSAGHFSAVTTYPKYSPANIQSANQMRLRLMQGGMVEISGVVFDKKTGKLSALTLQNQAEPGQKPFIDEFQDEYECHKVDGDSLAQFAAEAVRAVILSMASIRDEAAASSQGRKLQQTARRAPVVIEVPEKNFVDITSSEPSDSQVVPSEGLDWSEAYIESLAKKTKFVISCKSDQEHAVRIAMYNERMKGFPLLRIEHNENDLKYSGSYSFERLSVETYLKPIHTSDRYNALVVMDRQTGDEIYPAGLNFLVELVTHDSFYQSSKGRPLREGSHLPTDMLPPISSTEQKVLRLNLDQVLIDRVSLKTKLFLSWSLRPRVEVHYTCDVSKTPKEESAQMLRDSFDAIREEQNRITKGGPQNRL